MCCWPASIVLVAVGVILVFAASPAVAERIYGDGTRFITKHILFLMPATLLLLGVSILSPRGVLRLAVGMLVLFSVMLLLTLFIGHEVKGAKRWLLLFGGCRAAERVREAGAGRGHRLAPRSQGRRARRLPETMARRPAPCCALTRQPDIGMAAVIGFVYGVQLFVAGLAAVLGARSASPSSAAWQRLRLLPARAAHQRVPRSRPRDGYQVERALRAVSHGGLFGRGPGEGTTKFHLPDAHADFIFAVAAEEFGLLFCLLLVGLFAFVVLRGLRRVFEQTDLFVLLAGAGLLVLFGMQALINMAVDLQPDPDQGHDPAVHHLRRLVDDGPGPSAWAWSWR